MHGNEHRCHAQKSSRADFDPLTVSSSQKQFFEENRTKLEELFGRSDKGQANIIFVNDNAKTSDIISAMQEKYTGIDIDRIAIIAQSGIKNDRPETLVVSLDPKAGTSAGIIEYTARLFIKEDTAKQNDDGIVVYMPIVPLDYYVLIQGAKLATTAVSSSA